MYFASDARVSDLAWSRVGVEPAELPEIAEDCEVFRVLQGLLLSRHSPSGTGFENE